ncbi:MAG: sigma-70 family RNA polymerase sigma factor [Cyclobacteriaceae bacterium]
MKTSEHIIEEWLVINCQSGDRKALELLIKRWQPKMIRRVFHTTGDKAASQDIVQDAWITIIKKMNTLRDPGAFQWWSLKIATLKAIDWIRANQRDRKREELRETAQHDFDEDDKEQEETLSLLRQSIHQLPEDQRQLIQMFYQENLSVLTISRILNVPPGTVKSRLFKTRKKLKEYLETKILAS